MIYLISFVMMMIGYKLGLKRGFDKGYDRCFDVLVTFDPSKGDGV